MCNKKINKRVLKYYTCFIYAKEDTETGTGLPVNLDTTGLSSELLGLATISVLYINDMLIFAMEIPIIDSFEFTLYKPIPLPIRLKNDTYTMIVPNSDYIALDKSLLYYLELSELQLSKCKRAENQLICLHDQQVHHVDGS